MRILRSALALFAIGTLCLCPRMTLVAEAGVYEDLGQPFIGAWMSGAWVFHDPVLEKDLLWSQECSQDGAVLYAVDLRTGAVVEEHDVPCREIRHIMATEDGVLYISAIAGLTHIGNELIRLDPRVRKLERLGFPDVPRNRIASETFGRDGNIYIGTHQEGRLFRFNLASDEWTDMGIIVPEPIVPRQNIWIGGVAQLANGTILAGVSRAPKSSIVAVDPKTGKFRVVRPTKSGGYRTFGDLILETLPAGFRTYDTDFELVSEVSYRSLDGADAFAPDTSFAVVEADENKGMLLKVGSDVIRADIKGGRIRKLATLPFPGSLLVASDNRVVVADFGRTTLGVGPDRFAVVDLDDGTFDIAESKYQPRRGTQICGLTKASDGSIYTTDIIGMHIARTDPRTGKTVDLGHVGWPGGEVYNTIDHGGLIYFGSYGGGHWGVYDPKRPWRADPQGYGADPSANPHQICQLGGETPNDINRPFEYVNGPDGKIYIAARANYREPGGSLGAFDPKTGASQVFRDVLRSVQSVTADDRYVFGGTNIRGGRGSGDRAEVATLFVHDPKTGKRVFEKEIVPGAKAIVCVRYNPADKRVYATSDNQVLLALDPRSFEVLETWKIRSPGTALAGVPEDVGMLHITPAADGNIYGIASRDLYRLDVKSGKLEYLDAPPIPGLYQIVEGAPGEFYIGARTHLLKYRLETPPFYR